MKRSLLLLCLLNTSFLFAQVFSPKDYCLVWSDEFNGSGAPNPTYWGYEQGYVRNNEAQYYAANRLENARMEGGNLVIEAREDNWNGNKYTSASLITSGKVLKEYGRFEIRAKIDVRQGSWPAFWTLGQNGEWPSNGEIDIMEYYGGNLHANVAWGSATRYQGIWNSQTRDITSMPSSWLDSFHVYRMEWDPQFIHLYVDDVLMNTTDLSQTINQSNSSVKNPFMQPHYIVLNQAIGGNNGGDPSGTQFPIRYEIDYIRIYQAGSCHLDCNWQEGGSAYLDNCTNCVGGNTRQSPCIENCSGNLIKNADFETGDLSQWEGWGTRSVTKTAGNIFQGSAAVQVGSGSSEQVVQVQPYSKYTLKAEGKKAGGGWFRLGVKEHGNLEAYIESSSTDWTNVSMDFTTGNSTTARIYFYNGSGGGTAYGDNFQLQPSGCFVTAVQQAQEREGFELYPNPSQKNFTFKTPKTGILKIFDSWGKLVQELNVYMQLTFGEGMAPGKYTLQFYSGKEVQIFPWIKY